jgi:hypothetical protein
MAKEENNEQQYDHRFTLTSLMSRYIVMGMARFKDIVSGITQQTSRKSLELAKDLEELNSLRASWQRYSELSKQIESKERTVKIGFALLFNAPMKANPRADAYSSSNREYLGEMQQEANDLAIGVTDLDLSSFSLWRVIREVVRQTAEIRVFELEAHLKSFGLKKATRPAIESAFITHPKEFKLTKRGREKFVSLR